MNNYTSDEELYFSWWLDELEKRDLISRVKYQPKSFELSRKIQVTFIELLKTKTKQQETNLLAGHEYQADFLFYWSKKLHKILYVGYDEVLNKNIKKYPFVANYSEQKDVFFSVVDVKGNYNQNDAWRRFSIEQKWVFQMYGIYVQKIIPHPQVTGKGKIIPTTALFPNTFVPDRFLITNKSGAERKIKYDFNTINEFMRIHLS